MEKTYTLRAVIFPERINDDVWWVAQCLEHDISSQARHMREAIDELSRMVAIQICASEENSIEPLKGLPKAPEKFWMMFREGLRLAEKPEINVPEALFHPRPMQELSVYA